MRQRAGMALLALLLGVLTVLAGAGPAAASPSEVPTRSFLTQGLDCKETPLPEKPDHPFMPRPPLTSQGDPFAEPDKYTIEEVYGWGATYFTYDNGCGPAAGVLPSFGEEAGDLIGLEIPGIIASIGHSLQRFVLNPDSWLGPVDDAVADATQAIANGVWTPWLAVSLLIVAVLMLARSRAGELAGTVTAGVWAMLVLVVVSWTISYPSESTKMVDDGIQSAVLTVANGFSSTEPGSLPGPGDKGQAALDAMNNQWDDLARATVYRTWLEGTFGDANSATAQKYGGTIYQATHFSWAEWDTYEEDPDGAGEDIVDAKADAFEEAADAIKDSDPVAYDYMTGNRWGDRIATAGLGLVLMVATALFLAAAGVGMLLAYLVIRVVVPFSPAAGVLFMLEPMRDVATSVLAKVAKILVMGPLFFVAALLTLRLNSAVVSNPDIPALLALVIVAAVSWLAWKAVRPGSVFPGARSLRRLLTMATAVKIGTAGNDGDDKEKEKRKVTADDSGADSPVAETDMPSALMPSRQPFALGSAAVADQGERQAAYQAGELEVRSVKDQREEHAEASAFRPVAVSAGPQQSVRRARSLSAAPGQEPEIDETPGSQEQVAQSRYQPFAESAGEEPDYNTGEVIEGEVVSLEEDGVSPRPRRSQRYAPASVISGGHDLPAGSDLYSDSGDTEPSSGGEPTWDGGTPADDHVHQLEPQAPARPSGPASTAAPVPGPVGSTRVPSTAIDAGDHDVPATAGPEVPVAAPVWVNESNVTFDEQGERVFRVYSPEGSRDYRVEPGE